MAGRMGQVAGLSGNSHALLMLSRVGVQALELYGICKMLDTSPGTKTGLLISAA